MIHAILFDLDGLLIDSEHLFYEANVEYFKPLGLEYTEELHKQATGKRFEQWIKTVFDTPKSGEELLQERNEIMHRIVRRKLDFTPGAEEFLKMARENFHTALVTSSPHEYVEVVFDTLPINEYFNTLVTGEMVTKGKPDPECYLAAAKELDVDPATCVVMEDSPAGVQAGKAAGMTVIAVPSHYVKEDPRLGNADLIVGTLHEVTLDYLMTL